MPGPELKAGARKLMADNAPKLFVISAILVLVETVMSELQFRLPGTSDAYTLFLDKLLAGEQPSLELFYTGLRPVGVALAALLWLISPVIEAGYMSYCLKVTRGAKGGYKDILDGFLFFGKIILISILSWVFILLWSLLLIFPGVIAAYRYRQAYYILLDDPKKGALQCIMESKRLMAGNKLDMFLLDLSFLGWVLLDYAVILIIPLPFSVPLVSVFLTPYMGLTRAGYYNTLINKLVV